MVDPAAAAVTAPAVNPGTGFGLGGRCQPGATKNGRRDRRSGPFSQATEKQSAILKLSFFGGAARLLKCFVCHKQER
jgi:hypothetical protein